MDLFIGMRIVAFGSFVLGVSTFTLCGVVYVTNTVSSPPFDTNGCEDGLNETNHHPTVEHAFETFRAVVCHATIVVMIVAALQIVSATVILGSALQGCRERTKIWFSLNLGINLILLLAPLMTAMYGEDLQIKFSLLCFNEMRKQVVHLDSYYIGVGIDFIVQFHALIACLLMLRFDKGREYQLVQII